MKLERASRSFLLIDWMQSTAINLTCLL